MPTSTFFHLPEEKQKRLLDAAKEEFSRVPLKEASIANIVKLAEIPRGSFYQYFEDKEDLYFYYFHTLKKTGKKDIENYLKQSNGDFIEGLEQYFSKLLQTILKGENASFYKNLFLYMDYRASNRVTPHFIREDQHQKNEKCDHKHEHPHGEHMSDLFDSVDLSKLNLHNKREFQLLLQMFMGVVFTSVSEGYRQLAADPDYDIEQIQEEFTLKISWLKHGVYLPSAK